MPLSTAPRCIAAAAVLALLALPAAAESIDYWAADERARAAVERARAADDRAAAALAALRAAFRAHFQAAFEAYLAEGDTREAEVGANTIALIDLLESSESHAGALAREAVEASIAASIAKGDIEGAQRWQDVLAIFGSEPVAVALAKTAADRAERAAFAAARADGAGAALDVKLHAREAERAASEAERVASEAERSASVTEALASEIEAALAAHGP